MRTTARPGSGHDVIVLAGDREVRVAVDGAPPQCGDVFLLVEGSPPKLGAKIGGAAAGAAGPDSDAMRWRTRDAQGRTRMETLWQRHTVKKAIRDYLHAQNFIEIDAPVLVRGTTPDVALESFGTDGRYLVTSTEYQIKRLEVGGFDRIYTLAQNFRRGDSDGVTRNPEFTMLEWARVGQSLATIEADVEAFTRWAHLALGGTGICGFGAHRVDIAAPWERLTVAQAVLRAVGVALPDFSLAAIRGAVAAAGVKIQAAWQDDVHFLFAVLMSTIQPSLGCVRPVFVRDWPAFETSSAQPIAGGDRVDRSELFIAGVEVADGFASLTDPDLQERGFAQHLARRAQAGKPDVALDQAYLAALRAGLPSGAGMALGLDRLVMVLTDRADIRQVLAFAWDEL